ncbi:unnamed protein product [Cyclocybe aegerita]|uniref:Ubiquitin-like protease family profile domain-containing protein n=1 Tax=Cyclocybe aegerita TaxID=1973307 RepID=A0A8S0XJU4_CYCAE|nr:unnamed protein product [Cyclocybe aegerita]
MTSMISRKRQAPETLLPLRNPKQPRRTLKGYGGGPPSPSQEVGILARYRRIGKDAAVLLADTVAYWMPATITMSGQSESFVQDEVTSGSSVSSSSSISTPRQTPSPDVKVFSNDSDGSQGDVKSQKPQAFVHLPTHSETKIPSIQQYLSTRQSTFSSSRNVSNAVASTSTSNTPSATTSASEDNTLALLDDTSLDTVENFHSTPRAGISQNSTSMRSDKIPASSSRSTEPADRMLRNTVVPTMADLRLDRSLNSSQLSKNSTPFSLQSDTRTSSRASNTSKRHPLRHRNREHIFAKVHKANVQRAKLELRESMVMQLYQIKRRSGFTSGLSDFRGLLDYQRQLQNIDFENAPRPHRPSSSFSTPLAKARQRDASLDDVDDANTFLSRALNNAKATLNSPKPPQPYIPSLEQLQISRKAQQTALDRRHAVPDSLPPDDDMAVNKLLQKRGVIAKFAREQVSDQDISRLRPGQWLNDEIINFYGAMILARSEASKENPNSSKKPGKEPWNIHYFSSFFWAKLVKEGYDKGRLAKWTKKIDIFSKDMVIFPVNHGNAHWTTAAINFRKRRLETYDSMGMAKEAVFKHLRAYLDAEHANKKSKPFDWTGWQTWAPADTPQQENGYDCGVFTCHFLEALSRGEESFAFAQKDMPYLRRRMIWEIGNAKLRDGFYA